MEATTFKTNGTVRRRGDLKLYYTNKMSRQEWLAYRQLGIGGSDIGVILGLNKYKSATQLFYEKLGLYPSDIPENMAMFMGSFLEDNIAQLWQYWEESEDKMIDNYNASNKVRSCRRVNAFIVNPTYPRLFASIDREIIDDKKGILECKTISGYAASMWESGIPPYHVAQLQQYLLITGYSYGEMAILKDGRHFEIYPFKNEKEIQQQIIEQSRLFWNRIELARPVVRQIRIEEAKSSPDKKVLEGLGNRLADLEPEADSSPAYETFMKERYRNVEGVREGLHDELDKALAYDRAKQLEKEAKATVQTTKNKVIEMVGKMEVVDFGGQGKVTYRTNKRGIKQLLVKVCA